jgi:hypothetical protein
VRQDLGDILEGWMSDQARKPTDRPGDLEIPDLDLGRAPPRTSGTTPTAAAAPPAKASGPAQSGSAYGGDFDFGDDDDMEIDRNIAPSLATATTAPMPRSGGRIELGDDVVQSGFGKGSHVKVAPRTDWLGGISSTVLVALFAGGAGYALVRFAHRPGGWNVAPFAQKALDGGSATWSGAGSLSFLALAITLTIMAMFARPRSLAYGFSALAAVVIGVTLMIITFSVGPDGAPDVPPDGAVLIPWLFAMIPLGIALRLLRNAWAKCFEGEATARLSGILLAAFAAAAAFASAELLFGAGIRRFFTLF